MKKLLVSLFALLSVQVNGQITNASVATNDGLFTIISILNSNDNYLALSFTNLSTSNSSQLATNLVFSNLVANLQATNVILSNLVYNLQATNVVLSNAIYNLHVNGIAATWTNLVSGVLTQRLVTVGGILVSNETISY